MKAVIRAFWTEPLVFLGVLSAVATGLTGSDIIAPWVGVVIVGVVTALQRSVVTPTQNP